MKRLSIFLALFFPLISYASLPWVGPTAIPPHNNTPPPVNVSSGLQTKTGSLWVNGMYNNGQLAPFGIVSDNPFASIVGRQLCLLKGSSGSYTFDCRTEWPGGGGGGTIYTENTSLGGSGGVSRLTAGDGIFFNGGKVDITNTGTISADKGEINSAIGECGDGMVLKGVRADGSRNCVAINSPERPSEVIGSGEAGYVAKWDGQRSLTKSLMQDNGEQITIGANDNKGVYFPKDNVIRWKGGGLIQGYDSASVLKIGGTLALPANGPAEGKILSATDADGTTVWKSKEELGLGGGDSLWERIGSSENIRNKNTGLIGINIGNNEPQAQLDIRGTVRIMSRDGSPAVENTNPTTPNEPAEPTKMFGVNAVLGLLSVNSACPNTTNPIWDWVGNGAEKRPACRPRALAEAPKNWAGIPSTIGMVSFSAVCPSGWNLIGSITDNPNIAGGGESHAICRPISSATALNGSATPGSLGLVTDVPAGIVANCGRAHSAIGSLLKEGNTAEAICHPNTATAVAPADKSKGYLASLAGTLGDAAKSISAFFGLSQDPGSSATAQGNLLEVGGSVGIDGNLGINGRIVIKGGNPEKDKVLVANDQNGSATWKMLGEIGGTGGGGIVGPAGPAGPQGPSGTVGSYRDLPTGAIAGYGAIGSRAGGNTVLPVKSDGSCESGWTPIVTGITAISGANNMQFGDGVRFVSCIKN